MSNQTVKELIEEIKRAKGAQDRVELETALARAEGLAESLQEPETETKTVKKAVKS